MRHRRSLLSTVGAVAVLTTAGLDVTDARAQQPPPAKLRTYVSPLEYYSPAYAVPAAGAAYLFYPGDTVQFEVAVVNKDSIPVAIQLGADPSTHLSLGLRAPAGDSTPITRQAWTLALDHVRLRPREAAEVLVAAGSSVVLHPDAALILPIAFSDTATWPTGLAVVSADVSLTCEPKCAVVPHANLFHFEARTTLDRIDRMETQYRRALRGLFAPDLDDAERALQALDAEDGNTASGLSLHGRVAERRGDRRAALNYYRAAEAALLSRRNGPDTKNMGTSFDDFLHNIRSSIRRLENVK